MTAPLTRKRILVGMRVFLFLTVLGLTLVFFVTGTRQTWEALKAFNPWFLLLALGLVLVDFFSGASRIYIFLKGRIPNCFAVCFKANLANIFLAAATPFQTGGGLAQLYVLNHYGIPYTAGLTVSVLNFVATLSLLFFSASVVLTSVPHRLVESQSLLVVLDISRFAFYFTLIIFLLFMIRPSICGKFFQAVLAGLSRRLPRYQKTFSKWQEKLLVFVDQYQQTLYTVWKKEKSALVWNVILTLILYFNKCLVAFVIITGLGISAPFWDVILLQMLVIFFLYFAPTPGASLIAETGMPAVMSWLLPAYALSLFTVMWRFFTTYVGVFLGSLVLLRILAPELSTSAAIRTPEPAVYVPPSLESE